LGNLSLRDSEARPDALQKVTALDSHTFLPHVMTMQRAQTPWQFNTPNRVIEDPVAAGPSVDLEQPSAMSTGGKAASKKEISASRPLPANYVRRIRAKAVMSRGGPSDHRSQIADLTMLAESASRSGNIDQASQAYHKVGVILDNQGMHAEAVKKYKRLLPLCLTSQNHQVEALAYNCLGIDTFKLGQYDDSIQYHNKHLELADGTGRLIAHTNLGIVFHAMGLSEHAAIHHQHAIEYANRMGLKEAQCFTVGNLGIASAAQGDLQTSRICLQYHLTAAERQKHNLGNNTFARHTLKEIGGSANRRLGEINTSDGRFDEAASQFGKAMELAKSKGDQQGEQHSSAMIGIARGLAAFDQHRSALIETAEKGTVVNAGAGDEEDEYATEA
jgi:tetratricopeptide (TPR) repeat protein